MTTAATPLMTAEEFQTLSPQEKQALIDTFYWYHAMTFDGGLRSRGTVDPEPTFAQYGLPSLVGKSVLDVGTSSGYFALKFEQLGARRVLATDVDLWSDPPPVDLPPRTRARRLQKYQPLAGEEPIHRARAEAARRLGFDQPNPFYLARALRRSSVELRYVSIYDLASLEESFDLVFVGTVSTHLRDLAGAFEAVRHVTRERAIIACADVLDYASPRGWARIAFHGIRLLRLLGRIEDQIAVAREDPVARYTANEGGSIWRPSTVCVRELLLSAGFRDVQVYSRFAMANLRRGTPMHHVVFHAFV